VGSTEIAAELGDRRWRDLVRRYHAIVRRGLKRDILTFAPWTRIA
jgi:class 3 adenylate cyclase